MVVPLLAVPTLAVNNLISSSLTENREGKNLLREGWGDRIFPEQIYTPDIYFTTKENIKFKRIIMIMCFFLVKQYPL